MIKESIQTVSRVISADVQQSAVTAVMKKDITRTGCRVYKDGGIGVAGTLGAPSRETWERAEAALANGLRYPFEPASGVKKEMDLRTLRMSDREFVGSCEELLSRLAAEFPDFIFSNKLRLEERISALKNDAGTELFYADSAFEVELLVKPKDSANVFDTGYFECEREWDIDACFGRAAELVRAYRTLKELPEGRVKVVTTEDLLVEKFAYELRADRFMKGASLFSGKRGEKLFSDSFTLTQNRSSECNLTPFFDSEGVFSESGKCELIKNGVIVTPYTDRRTAEEYSLPLTASAGGDYDDMPQIEYQMSLYAEPGESTLFELLAGEPGILVLMASGGDYTSAGDYASPVQNAYLTDGKRLLGRLPECSVSGNIYDIFGRDYYGKSSDKAFFGTKLLCVGMDVRIG